MTSRVDRTNRAMLILLGLLFVLGGATGLALGLRAFGRSTAATPVISASMSNFVAGHGWFWWAVAALAVIVALLTLRWLFAQLHTSRLSHLDVEPDHGSGQTVLRSGALADGVEHEVRGFLGVRDATMRLQGKPGDHRHQLTVHLDERADIDAVRSRLATKTVPNIRRALDFEEPTLDIRLVLADHARRRID